MADSPASNLTFGISTAIQIGAVIAMGAIMYAQTGTLREEASITRTIVAQLQSVGSEHRAKIEGLEREAGRARDAATSLLDRLAKTEGALSCRGESR